MLEILGFTTPRDAFWNTLGYGAFVAIIFGSRKIRTQLDYGNALITTGAAILAVYAGIFLRDPLLTVLQTYIVFAGVLQWRRQYVTDEQRMWSLLIAGLGAVILAGASFEGDTVGLWILAGVLGLMGIAVGLAVAPHRDGALYMSIGGDMAGLDFFINFSIIKKYLAPSSSLA
jgi:peptidoglycan/LPS O-acetylase OafA/YrhL